MTVVALKSSLLSRLTHACYKNVVFRSYSRVVVSNLSQHPEQAVENLVTEHVASPPLLSNLPQDAVVIKVRLMLSSKHSPIYIGTSVIPRFTGPRFTVSLDIACLFVFPRYCVLQ